MRIVAVILALVTATGAFAEEQIPPEEFLAEIAGFTVDFSEVATGNYVGTEQVFEDGRSAWVRADGSCTQGVIRAEGPLICFYYEDRSLDDRCWIPGRDDQGIFIVTPDLGYALRVTRFSRQPVICDGAPVMSSL